MVDYIYDPKVVNTVERATYYRGVVFLLLLILPIGIIAPVFPAGQLRQILFGIGCFCVWSFVLFLFDYLIRRIEIFTIQHRHDTIRIIDKTIYWFDRFNGLNVSIEISEATIDYCYYAVGRTVFKITDKNKDNIIYFSTDLSRFEEILELINHDFSWPPE
jgi:hypothetical protein